jgi:energy-converting hydrogenase Eha subunit G
MLATAIYILCALTSIICAALLLRGWSQTRARLLFWSGLCFAGLALNNILLIIDVTVLPQVDMEMWRTVPALVGVALLVYGLIWETPR